MLSRLLWRNPFSIEWSTDALRFCRSRNGREGQPLRRCGRWLRHGVLGRGLRFLTRLVLFQVIQGTSSLSAPYLLILNLLFGRGSEKITAGNKIFHWQGDSRPLEVAVVQWWQLSY